MNLYELLYYVSLTLLVLVILCRLSDYVRCQVKYVAVYTSYFVTSVFLALACMRRPFDPTNGTICAWLIEPTNDVLGIRWTIKGQENVKPGQAYVVVCNHQSMIDVLAMMKVWPILNKCVPIVKRELMYAGPFGLALYLSGAVFVDRFKSPAKGRASINKAGTHAKENGISMWVFPEGTRNRQKDGQMLDFKKGAFHVALDAKMPILPIVVSEYDFIDSRKKRFEVGEPMIQIMEPVDTGEYTKEDMDQLIGRTRKAMIQTLQEISKKKK